MFAAQAHCVPKLVGRQACGGERENFVNALIKVRHPIKTNLHHHPLSLSHSSQNAEEQTTINYFFELIKINVSTFEEMRKGIY